MAVNEGIRLAGPSREVPLAAKLQFLFGGFYNQFGWAWTGFSSIHVRLFLFEGTRKGIFEWPMLFMLVFPAIGLTMMSVGVRKGLRALRLLTHGIPAQGRFVCQEATNVRINDTPVMAMTFEFKTVDGRTARCMAKTHETRELQDDAEEPLVYDPEDPSRAVLLDELPGRPRITEDSVVRSREGIVWHLLLVPVGTALMHIVWTFLS
ncbi:MAG: hypothetical protein FD126_2226 [Elusimicrobia bacterium]|nr:MAG: hypothetical protein FD126_2226 [Elusimicrobiota bacterium]